MKHAIMETELFFRHPPVALTRFNISATSSAAALHLLEYEEKLRSHRCEID